MSEELFNQIIISWVLLGVIVFFVNLKIIAPYGRHASGKWGPLIESRFAWIIMESPVLFVVTYLVLSNIEALTVVGWVLFIVFVAHYLYRSFIYPFKLKGSSKKMPLGVIVLAIMFNLINGFFIGFYLGNFAHYDSSWFYSLPFTIGAVLFCTGAFINWQADSILIALRDNGSREYKIPKGFLFEKISCPNHLGEMIEWSGYALMSFNLPALSFAIWTMANLIPRSLAHHKWYKKYFNNYPVLRKAFMPGLW